MATKGNELKIFKLRHIKFNELYDDAVSYLKATYKATGQIFSTSSPFGQLLEVMLHLGRYIMYYIEDSITGLNIKTAYRPDQIRGLAMLTGHDASRAISARGAVRIVYYDKGESSLNGNVCYINNKFTIISKINGYIYTVFLGASTGKITMQSGNFLEATVIQGTINRPIYTGTGKNYQSFNVSTRNYAEIDQYYVNVYVNREHWETVGSLEDLGFKQKGCIVRTGINSGIDVFFGNNTNGAVPPAGAEIMVEYIISDGRNASDLRKDDLNATDAWEIQGNGVLSDGTTVPLNDNFKILCTNDIIFGSDAEDIALTQLLAPHASRSFVLANETNYKYFFKKMNMFSMVEVFRGSYNVNGSSVMQLAYDQASKNYDEALAVYNNALNTYDENSEEVTKAYKNLQSLLQIKNYTATKLSDNTSQDNTIYIFLIPDIQKRISTSSNYFSCDESLFYLSDEEQENIINLINQSGQRIMTIENKIIQPKITRFSVNVQAKIWDNYDEQQVYSAGLKALSDYFIKYERKDIIPVSDIVAIFETQIPGIDSVHVWFDADEKNQEIYGPGNYGLDNYGDIIMTRTITDASGSVQKINDILPLVRGGFTSYRGIEYSAQQSKESNSAFNLTITGKTSNQNATLSSYVPLT